MTINTHDFPTVKTPEMPVKDLPGVTAPHIIAVNTRSRRCATNKGRSSSLEDTKLHVQLRTLTGFLAMTLLVTGTTKTVVMRLEYALLWL